MHKYREDKSLQAEKRFTTKAVYLNSLTQVFISSLASKF